MADATGGTITTVGNYRIHKFTSSGTFVNPGFGTFDILLCGPGGDWKAREFENIISSCGGGGGDMVEVSSESFNAGNYSIVVGLASTTQDGDGTNTTGFGYTAIRGGKGSTPNGQSGGSGGAGGESGSGGASIANGYGYAGGKGTAGGTRPAGGGGGGAGGAGGNGDAGGEDGGDGGLCRYNSIAGTSRPYCAGGRGGYGLDSSSNRGSVGAMSDSDYGRGGYAPGGTGWSKTAQDGVVIVRYLNNSILLPGSLGFF